MVEILLIISQNQHVRIIDFISKSACAQHHFPVILIRDPMEAFGRYLATQSIIFTLVQGVSWGCCFIINIKKKNISVRIYFSCLTKTQGSRFQLLVQRRGVHSNSKIFLSKSNKVFGEGQASDFSLGFFNQDLPRSELGTSLYHGHN